MFYSSYAYIQLFLVTRISIRIDRIRRFQRAIHLGYVISISLSFSITIYVQPKAIKNVWKCCTQRERERERERERGRGPERSRTWCQRPVRVAAWLRKQRKQDVWVISRAAAPLIWISSTIHFYLHLIVRLLLGIPKLTSFGRKSINHQIKKSNFIL